MRFFLSDEARAESIIPLESPRQGDAGYDLRSAREYVIQPGEQVLVSTGLYLQIPDGWVGLLRDRSSMAKARIYVFSGVIDAAYRGEVLVILANFGNEEFTIHQNDKVVQMVVVPHLSLEPEQVATIQDLGRTDRGEKGFGSTGK